MKKFLQLICISFVVLLIIAGVRFLSVFPIDTRPYVEKKYSGWNGVLQAWVCTQWNPTGSFIRWLNSCASGFEKTHEGIYLEFTPVQKESLLNLESTGICVPDLIFFSPGIEMNPDILAQIKYKSSLRAGLNEYGSNKAIPIALGGYIWAYNPSLIESVPKCPAGFLTSVSEEDINIPALIGLLSGSLGESLDETAFPDSDIDLGLPVSLAKDVPRSFNILDSFLDGKSACIPADAKMLACLKKLREGGKGPAWSTAVSGEFTCTDQILLAAVPIQAENHDRSVLAEEFISLLLEEDAQNALADIGAFSVTGNRIHSDFSVYGKTDAMLNHLPLWLPSCFSEYSVSNSEAIVRGFLKGEISAKKALGLLGFEEV